MPHSDSSLRARLISRSGPGGLSGSFSFRSSRQIVPASHLARVETGNPGGNLHRNSGARGMRGSPSTIIQVAGGTRDIVITCGFT